MAMNRDHWTGAPILTTEELIQAMAAIIRERTAARFGVAATEVTSDMIDAHIECEDAEMHAMARREGWQA